MKLHKVVLLIGAFISVAGYLGWTVLSDQPDARQAQLHPLHVIMEIVSQLARTAPLSEWNIPFLSLGVWALWLLLIYSHGISITQRLLPASPALSCSTRGAISFAIGFVSFGIVQFIYGVLGFASWNLILLFFLFNLVNMTGSDFRKELLGLPRAIIFQWRSLSFSGRLTCAALLLPILLLVVPALTPPVQSDGMRYHLGAVQEYIKLGAIRYLPHNAYSNMPFLVEMHFLGALNANVPEASQLMHLTLALFTVLAIYSLIRHLSQSISNQLIPRWLCLLSAILYLGTPMSAVLATWPFTDHGMSFFLLATLLAALTCTERTGSYKAWVILGTCAGGLLGVKYTMAPVALATIGLPWFVNRRIINPETNIGKWPILQTIVGLTVMAVTGGVWYIKNLLFTGNPFYPIASQWFPGGDWSLTNDQFLHARAGSKGMGQGVLDLLILPWNATFRWMNFEHHNPGATLLIATLTALCAFVPTKSIALNRKRYAVFAIALLTFVIWFFSYQSNRLLLPTIAVALSLTPVYLLSQHHIATRLYASAIALATACGFAWAIQWSWVATALTPPPLPYLLGAKDARTFRYKSLTYALAFDYLNQRVKPYEKVLLIGEHRIYGATFKAEWSDWFDTPRLATILRKNNITNVPDLLTFLRSDNIRWILINERELAPQLDSLFRPWFNTEEWELFEQLRRLTGPNIKVITLPPGVTILYLEELPE